MALANFTGALAPPPGEFPFPKNANMVAELTDTASGWSVVIQHHIDDFVLPRFEAIPATMVSGKAGGAKVAWNTPAQITKIVRNESDAAFTPPSTNNLPNALSTRFD